MLKVRFRPSQSVSKEQKYAEEWVYVHFGFEWAKSWRWPALGRDKGPDLLLRYL